MDWLSNGTIQIPVPKKPKKLTGTRFATILGLNPWATPFEVWCEVTRTYQKPFEDTIYTIAGKTIEPKQAEFMKKSYFMPKLVAPADIWGKDYFKKTWGDFFPERKIFGGMWDYYLPGADGKATAVLEMKTTKRAEDWEDDIPEYYALQAALYAYLMGIENVIMVASFLEESDYAHPEEFVCTVDNTIVRPFNLHERYPNFGRDYIQPAIEWWNEYVETGISPMYDEKKDAEILTALRTNGVTPDTSLEDMVREAEALKAKLDAAKAAIAEDEDRYKVLSDAIKAEAVSKFRDGDKKVTISGGRYRWNVSRTVTTKVDRKALERDGLLDEKYLKKEESYRMTLEEIKED